MPITAPSPSALAKTTAYPSSPSSSSPTSPTLCENNGAQRHFCTKCGCHVFRSRPQHIGDTNGQKDWEVATGVLNDLVNFASISKHINISDTKDGGLSVWITEYNNDRLYLSPSSSPDHIEDKPSVTITSQSTPFIEAKVNKDSILPAHCACSTVKFHITRPNPSSVLPHSQFPDLMIPYHTKDPRIPNEEDEKWWLKAPIAEFPMGAKYLAGTCACRSCRLTSGFEVQTWVFVPRGNIYFHIPSSHTTGSYPDTIRATGPSPEDKDLATEAEEAVVPLDFTLIRHLERSGTPILKSYESSPGVIREFCPVCGATVFWHDKWRPEVVDVSVGLLDAREGARAEGWLEWWGERVSFAEDAEGRGELVESLGKGLGAWDAGRKALEGAT